MAVADLTILLKEDAGGMPTDLTGPPARANGESAVPAKRDTPNQGKEASEIKSLTSDLLGWLGLGKLATLASRIQDTFEKTEKVIARIRAEQDRIGPTKPLTQKPEPSWLATGAKPTDDQEFDRFIKNAEFNNQLNSPEAWEAYKRMPEGKPTWRPPVYEKPDAPPLSVMSKPVTPSVAAGPAAGEAAGATAAAGTAGASEGLATIVAVASNPLTIALATVTGAVVASGIAFKKLTDTLSAEVKKLENFSGPVAAAQARSEMRNDMAMIRRGEQIGPQLARFQNDMSRWNEAMADVWTRILKVLIDIYEGVRPVVQLLTGMLKLVESGIEVTEASIEMVAAQFTATNKDNLIAARDMAAATAKVGTVLKEAFGEETTTSIDPVLANLLASWGVAPAMLQSGGKKPRQRPGAVGRAIRGGAAGILGGPSGIGAGAIRGALGF